MHLANTALGVITAATSLAPAAASLKALAYDHADLAEAKDWRNPNSKRNERSCDGFSTEVTIKTDRKPEETAWTIARVNGCGDGFDVVAESEPFQSGGTEFFYEDCLPITKYRLEITDTGGDGLCCAFERGGWRLKVEGLQVTSGTFFGSSDGVEFGFCDPASTSPPNNPPTSEPTLFPTLYPTLYPTLDPTRSPTHSPTRSPTRSPTVSPTLLPTVFPTLFPTLYPTLYPTLEPSATTPGPATPEPATPEPTSALTPAPTPDPANLKQCILSCFEQ